MKYRIQAIIFIFIIISLIIPAYATDVNSNGTAHPQGITSSGLNTTITSEGSTFNITGGTQQGGNLFHSFGKFNLHSGESAVFNDSGITNTIGRINGGEYSWINGKITSDAANLYLLNPAGILFGSNASLDLAGSFHVSTADYLRMGENEKFFAGPLENEVLSVESPTAFGFLDKEDLEGFAPFDESGIQGLDEQGLISLEGKGEEITEQEWKDNPSGLQVPDGKTISFIGREINISKGVTYEIQKTDNDGNPVMDDAGNPVMEKEYPGDIRAYEGTINLVSVASGGEVVMTENGSDISDIEKTGKITISDKACINVSERKEGINGAGGAVYIRAGEFVLEDGRVEANTRGTGTGKGIDIQAEKLLLTDGARINATSYGPGDSGDIKIQATDLITLSGENDQGDACKIFSNADEKNELAGNAGNIELTSKELQLNGGAEIATASFGSGKGGNIKIQGDLVSLSGESSSGSLTKIISKTQGQTENAGNGGTIEIITNELQVTDGAQIAGGTYGPGNGGNIKIQAGGTVKLSGENKDGKWQSGVYAGTESTGDGGTIELSANHLSLDEGSQISTTTFGEGSGGDIKIQANDTVNLSGENPSSDYATGIYANANGESESAGKGGTIQITTKELHLTGGAQMGSSTDGPGDGGDVKIHADNTIMIDGEGNWFSSGISTNTTSEDENGGKSGTIELTTNQLHATKGGWVAAISMGTGDGGDIKIQANSIFLSEIDSIDSPSGIFAASFGEMEGAGDGGTIRITAKDVHLDEFAEITTGSYGEGNAGEINLDVQRLQADNEALVSSQSLATENGGNAGTIRINAADSIRLSGDSAITTEASGAGGGQIFVKAGKEIFIFNGNITSSVLNGEGNGGDVETESEFVILNHGNITANAEGGDGGAIFIRTENFIKSADSAVTATSERGNDGTVRIEAPDLDITSGLMVLPSGTIDAAKWINFPCTERSGENVSRFVIRGKDGSPTPYDDLLPGSLPWLDSQ